LEERELAAAAAAGDEQAFTQLVERYRSYVYTIAYKIALDEDDALDIAQNVLVRLIEKIGAFNGTGTFKAWLGTIAVREAVSFLRRAGAREVPTAPETLQEIPDQGFDGRGRRDPLEALDAAQRRRRVETAMRQLAPQQRAIFALRFVEDMRPKEIAERLGLPPRQVRSQLHNAIDRIRQIVAENKGE